MPGRRENHLNIARPSISAAVYARYSSEMQAPTSALDQIERIKALAAKDQIESRLYPGAEVQIDSKWVLSDEAVSGKVAGRRKYQTILDGIRQRAFLLLIVDDLSRLTRSLGNLLELYQLLRHHDIELISVSDKVSSADPNARIFFTIKGMTNDFGNEAHSERTKRGLEARVRDGFSSGPKPYGYGSEATRKDSRKGRPVDSHFRIFIIESKAAIVRRVFRMYVDGYGKAFISKTLNAEGIPSPGGVLGGWKPGTVFKMLRSEKYAGKWIFNRLTYSVDPDTGKKVEKIRPRDQWLIVDREELRIIPQDLWNKAQELIEKNEEERKRARPGSRQEIFGKAERQDNRHLLSGALSCSACGDPLVLVSGRRGGYYGCFDAYNRGNCKDRTLSRRTKVEKVFIEFIRSKVSDERLISWATARYNEIVKEYLKMVPNRKNEIEVELRKVTTEIANLIRFVTEGGAEDIPSVTQTLRERESRRSRLANELDQINSEPEKRLLVTPYLVKSSLERVVDRISNRGPDYNGIIKRILSGPMTVNKGPDGKRLEGVLDLGETLGASRFTSALPQGFEPWFSP